MEAADSRRNETLGGPACGRGNVDLGSLGLVELDLLGGVGVCGVVEIEMGKGVRDVGEGVAVGSGCEPVREGIELCAGGRPRIGGVGWIPVVSSGAKNSMGVVAGSESPRTYVSGAQTPSEASWPLGCILRRFVAVGQLGAEVGLCS